MRVMVPAPVFTVRLKMVVGALSVGLLGLLVLIRTSSVAVGTPEAIAANKSSYTGRYLRGTLAASAERKRA